MKKIIYGLVFCALIFSASPAFALSYAVKQDGRKVYLDITKENNPVSEGQVFNVVIGEEPLYGVDDDVVGTIYTEGAAGRIIEVQPKFAVGELDEDYQTKNKQKVIITNVVMAVAQPPASFGAVSAAAVKEERNILFRSAPLTTEVLSAAHCRPFADGKDYLATVDNKNNVALWALSGTEFKEKEKLSFVSVQKPLSVSCADIKKTGKDQVFVTVKDEQKNKLPTVVFEEENGALAKKETLRWAVKTSFVFGKKEALAQDFYVHNAARTSKIGRLVYKNKFVLEKEKTKQPAWARVFSSLAAPFVTDGRDFLAVSNQGIPYVYSADTGRKTTAGSAPADGTANKFELAGTLIRVTPPLYARETKEGKVLVYIENIPTIGIVAGPFGSYKNAKLHYSVWKDVFFEDKTEIELPGALYDMGEASFGGKTGLMLPIVLQDGKTIIEII